MVEGKREARNLTKKDIARRLKGKHPDVRALVSDAQELVGEDRREFYGDMGSVLEGMENYPAAGNAYRLAGEEKKSSDMLKRIINSGSLVEYIEGRDRQYERTRGTAAVIATAGIVAGLFILTPNITGNAISNLSSSVSNLLGIGLIGIGLVGAYFCKE